MSLTCNGLRLQNLGMGWSQKLKAAAGAKKLSGAEIARRLGYSASSANEWLRGETEPEFSILQPLCELLGIQVAWLFDDSLSDDLTGPGLLACRLFDEILKERGPYAAMYLLEGSTASGKVNSGSVLPRDVIGHYKRPDREDAPTAVMDTVFGPPPGGRPGEIQLDDPPTGKGDPGSIGKRKRKPL
jgi:hypothetical protein